MFGKEHADTMTSNLEITGLARVTIPDFGQTTRRKSPRPYLVLGAGTANLTRYFRDLAGSTPGKLTWNNSTERLLHSATTQNGSDRCLNLLLCKTASGNGEVTSDGR
jgi:hypothetical protein